MRVAGLALGSLLLAACQAEALRAQQRMVIFGDSLSLGLRSAEPVTEGWPDQLKERLTQGDADWTIDNESINGNGLVWRTRCYGEPAIERVQSAALTLDGEAIIVLVAGVNDLIQPRLPKGYSDCFEPARFGATEIVRALAQLHADKPSQRILLATIPPFNASEFHSREAEADRQQVNRWIEGNWPRGDVIDLARVLASPGDTTRLNPNFDSGDGLHPNEKGKAAIAAAVRERIE